MTTARRRWPTAANAARLLAMTNLERAAQIAREMLRHPAVAGDPSLRASQPKTQMPKASSVRGPLPKEAVFISRPARPLPRWVGCAQELAERSHKCLQAAHVTDLAAVQILEAPAPLSPALAQLLGPESQGETIDSAPCLGFIHRARPPETMSAYDAQQHSSAGVIQA
jgi:hypothetical protein